MPKKHTLKKANQAAHTIFDLINFVTPEIKSRSAKKAKLHAEILRLHASGRSYGEIRAELEPTYPHLTRDAVIKVVKRKQVQEPSLSNPSPCTVTTIVVDWVARDISVQHTP